MNHPKTSPWGAVQHAETLAEGIVSVSTAGHGGLLLNTARMAALPERLVGKNRYGGGCWFEEDCEWAIVATAFPEAFRPEEREAARATMTAYFPGVEG